MRSFQDSTERIWTVAITIDTVKRVKALCNVNLLALEEGDPPLITQLATDIILLCDVLYAVIKPQADSVGLSDEDFAALLGGDVIRAAHTAFYEELSDFFLKLGREDQAKIILTQLSVISMAVKRVITKLEGLDLEVLMDKMESGG